MAYPRRSLALLAAALLASCAKPAPPPDPAKQRIPLTAAEIRRLVPNHFIDERPYPCDAGPLAFGGDGKFVRYSGWGNTDGTYTIGKGVIALDGWSQTVHFRWRLSFAKDGNGKLYYVDDDEKFERPLRLAPIDRNTPFITCGNDRMPAPPGDKR